MGQRPHGVVSAVSRVSQATKKWSFVAWMMHAAFWSSGRARAAACKRDVPCARRVQIQSRVRAYGLYGTGLSDIDACAPAQDHRMPAYLMPSGKEHGRPVRTEGTTYM